ncbi:hypothetical protein BH10ACI3_BH10ACI3_11270 [soil metagenome]
MENGDNNRKSSFEKLCRRIFGGCENGGTSGGELFEKDWEVFVVRFDPETGKHVGLTFCCENAVS